MTQSNYNIDNSIISSLDDSFFKEANREMQVEECFKTIDDRINYKIAEGLKRGTKLVFQKLNQHIQSKIKLMIDEEVDRRMLIHESKMHKQGKQSKSQSVTQQNQQDHLMLPIDMKSQGSLEVNTPQKKDSVQELKVFETIDGIQTFGRQKICSDRKQKSNEIVDNLIENNKSVFELQTSDLDKSTMSAAGATTIKVDKKVDKVKKSPPSQKIQKQPQSKVNINNNNSSNDVIAKERENNITRQADPNSGSSKKAWNSSTMTNGEEKNKKGSKLKAKLTQETNKEAPAPVAQRTNEETTATAKKTTNLGNHKKNQSKVLDVAQVNQIVQVASVTSLPPNVEEPSNDPKSESSGTSTLLNSEVQNNSSKQDEIVDSPKIADQIEEQNVCEMIEQPAPPEVDGIEIPQSLEIPDKVQQLETESQIVAPILKKEELFDTSILTNDDKSAGANQSFAIKPTAVESAPVPMVPSPEIPEITTTETVPSSVAAMPVANSAPAATSAPPSKSSSSTTGQKDSTAKKTSTSKRESLVHRTKSPMKVPGKGPVSSLKSSRMTGKVSGQDASQGQGSSAAGDEAKSRVRRNVRDSIADKDKSLAQINKIRADKSSEKPSTSANDELKTEGVKQPGQITEEGIKGEQKEQKPMKGSKTARVGQSSIMQKKQQDGYGATLEEKYKTSSVKKQATTRGQDGRHKLSRKQSVAQGNNFEPSSTGQSNQRKIAPSPAGIDDQDPKQHTLKNLNTTFQGQQSSMQSIKEAKEGKEAKDSKNNQKKRKRSYSPMMGQHSQIISNQLTEELKTKTIKKLGL